MFRIYPYMQGSRSVRALKNSLSNAKIIKLENSRYRPQINHTLINWGNSRVPEWSHPTVNWINHPDNVHKSTDKLHTLIELEEANVPCVPYTTDPQQVRDWLFEGSKVFARHTTTGHSGEGIEVLQPNSVPDQALALEIDDISSRLSDLGLDYLAEQVMEEAPYNPTDLIEVPDAPLYTKAVSNNGEYRVHVFQGDVIHYQKKCRRVERDEDGEVIERDEPNEEQSSVRNLSSGWVYRSQDLEHLERVEQLAIRAIAALGLDFGAVDIINDNNRNVYVLEVNTAVGLGNQQTLEAYVNSFNSISF